MLDGVNQSDMAPDHVLNLNVQYLLKSFTFNEQEAQKVAKLKLKTGRNQYN